MEADNDTRCIHGFVWSLTEQIRFEKALKTKEAAPAVEIIEEWTEMGAYDHVFQFKHTLALAIGYGNWQFVESYLLPRAPSIYVVYSVLRESNEVWVKGSLYDLLPEESDFLSTLMPDAQPVLCSDCVGFKRFLAGRCGRCTACVNQPLIVIEPCLAKRMVDDPVTVATKTLCEIEPFLMDPRVVRTEPVIFRPKPKATKSAVQRWFSWLADAVKGRLDAPPEEERRLTEMEQIV
jgi:hypothetical protein